jgi:hypothetical protein
MVSTSTRLLSLDSSAHLQCYRRSLGPLRKAAETPVAEALQAHVLKYGEFPHDSTLASNLSPGAAELKMEEYKPRKRTPRTCSVLRPSHVGARTPQTYEMVQTYNEAWAVPMVQPGTQTLPHCPTLSQAVPTPAHNTIPTMFRDALEQCNALHTPRHVDTRYEVVEDTVSASMDGERSVVGTYNTLREANERAVEYFVDVYLSAGAVEPEVEVMEGGRINCAIQKDGSLGGCTSVYVRQTGRTT